MTSERHNRYFQIHLAFSSVSPIFAVFLCWLFAFSGVLWPFAPQSSIFGAPSGGFLGFLGVAHPLTHFKPTPALRLYECGRRKGLSEPYPYLLVSDLTCNQYWPLFSFAHSISLDVVALELKTDRDYSSGKRNAVPNGLQRSLGTLHLYHPLLSPCSILPRYRPMCQPLSLFRLL